MKFAPRSTDNATPAGRSSRPLEGLNRDIGPGGSDEPFFHASLPAQLVMGAVFGALNVLVTQLVNLLHLPLFLDEFFNAAGAFFGWTGGFTSVLVHRTISIILPAVANPERFSFVPIDCLFGLCDIPVVVLVRLMFRRDRHISTVKLLLCGVILAIIISILGGGIFTFLFTCCGYGEVSSVRYLTMILTGSRIPLAPSAMLSRVPINLVDKPLCVFLGFLIARLVRRLLNMRQRRHKPSEA